MLQLLKIAAFLLTLLPGHLFAESKPIVSLKLHGTIHHGTVSVIESALTEAKKKNAEALLIELDTPGGLLDSTRDIVKLFLNSDIPVIVYVSPRGAHAGSAGTFITMAAHIAAMAPGTNIGAAHPISALGKDPEESGGKHLAKKVENDTKAFIQTIAKQRKRNVDWAQKAVIESAAVDETEAKKLNVIDFVATTKNDLLEKADGKKISLLETTHVMKTKGSTIVQLELDIFTRLKNWLANPTIMFLLILIAGVGFYIELSNPGLIFPAAAAVLATILLLVASSLIPLSVIGVGLIVLGFVLLLLELYVTSFGLLGASGVISFVIGAILLFDPAKTDLQVPRGMIVGAALGIGTIALLVALGLKGNFSAKQVAGAEGLVGAMGTVDGKIEPGKKGRVFVNGEYWTATADQALKAGDTVEIVSLDNLIVHVTNRS